MTRNEFRDIFMNEETWGLSYFDELCAQHNITPLEDEWFGVAATLLWDALSDEDIDDLTEKFETYFSK